MPRASSVTEKQIVSISFIQSRISGLGLHGGRLAFEEFGQAEELVETFFSFTDVRGFDPVQTGANHFRCGGLLLGLEGHEVMVALGYSFEFGAFVHGLSSGRAMQYLSPMKPVRTITFFVNPYEGTWWEVQFKGVGTKLGKSSLNSAKTFYVRPANVRRDILRRSDVEMNLSRRYAHLIFS